MTTINRRRFLETSMGLGLAAVTAQPAYSAERMDNTKSGYQIGCFTRPWDKYDYRAALDAIAEAGVEYAGLMTCSNTKNRLVVSVQTTPEEAQAIGEEVRKRNLKVPAVYGGNIPVTESLEAGIEGLKKLIDNCVAVGSASLLMGGTSSPELNDLYYKAIAECCDYAESKKLMITVKPHGGLNATGPQCRKLIEQVGHRNFTLMYDPGNIFYYSDGELNPVEDAKTVHGVVYGMCVKDYQHPKKVDVTPGTGQVNFRAVLAELQKGGFTQGPLVIETLAPGEKDAMIEEARKAREFLEKLIA